MLNRAAHRVLALLARLGFAPAGLSLERHLPGVRDRYELSVADVRRSLEPWRP